VVEPNRKTTNSMKGKINLFSCATSDKTDKKPIDFAKDFVADISKDNQGNRNLQTDSS
jgi:hypothetical protein